MKATKCMYVTKFMLNSLTFFQGFHSHGYHVVTFKAKQYKVHVDVPYALNANCKHYKGPEHWDQP